MECYGDPVSLVGEGKGKADDACAHLDETKSGEGAALLCTACMRRGLKQSMQGAGSRISRAGERASARAKSKNRLHAACDQNGLAMQRHSNLNAMTAIIHPFTQASLRGGAGKKHAQRSHRAAAAAAPPPMCAAQPAARVISSMKYDTTLSAERRKRNSHRHSDQSSLLPPSPTTHADKSSAAVELRNDALHSSVAAMSIHSYQSTLGHLLTYRLCHH